MEQQSLNFKTWLDEYFKPAVENFYSEEKSPFRMTVQLIIQELREVYTQIQVWLLSNLLTQHPFYSSRSNFNLKLRIYFFCCAGSSLLSRLFSIWGEQGLPSVCGAGFSLQWAGATVCLWRGLLVAVAALVGLGLSAHGHRQLWLPGSSAWGQQWWSTGLVAPWHVGSSQIRDQTCISCIGRWILYHRAAREALKFYFLRNTFC